MSGNDYPTAHELQTPPLCHERARLARAVRLRRCCYLPAVRDGAGYGALRLPGEQWRHDPPLPLLRASARPRRAPRRLVRRVR